MNLGIGLPTLVADCLPKGREIILHSENGVLGIGPRPAPGEEDEDLINAGKEPVTLLAGGSYFHHADSFGMIRGQHLDFCVLGAFQVSVAGDLANWHTGAPDAIPAVGGAMDLAVGAKQVLVMMEHLTKDGEKQDRRALQLPAHRRALRQPRLHRSLAVIDVKPDGLHLVEILADISFDELQRLNGVALKIQGGSLAFPRHERDAPADLLQRRAVARRFGALFLHSQPGQQRPAPALRGGDVDRA